MKVEICLFFIAVVKSNRKYSIKTDRSNSDASYVKITSARDCMPVTVQKMWTDSNKLNCEVYARRLKCRQDGTVEEFGSGSDWLTEYKSQM